MIPLSRPCLGEEEIRRVSQVLRSDWLTHGPVARELEKEFAGFVGVRNAVALSSATAALQLAVQLLPHPGEVILPSFTFVATANAVVNGGCVPVLVDVERDTGNINPDLIVEALTRETVALMPVHFAGRSCEMDALMNLANEHGLAVIEDSAEAIGASYRGKQVGSFGTGCFSFFPTKNMTCGEGGMLTTDDDDLAARVRAYRAHGIFRSENVTAAQSPWHREARFFGFNFRMPDILAAVALEQLRKLPEMNRLRVQHAEYLTAHLRNIEGVFPPRVPGHLQHVYQMYTVRLDLDLYARNQFVTAMKKSGIEVSVHFDPPLHRQALYGRFNRQAELPVTDEVSRSLVTFPMFPGLTRTDLDAILDATREALRGSRRQ